jgi:integrase
MEKTTRTTERIHLTPERIRRLPTPTGVQAVYVFDDAPSQLSVRVTPKGVKSFVFASKLNRLPLRVTLGSVDVWTLEDARNEARRLQVLIDQGKDPRQVAADEVAADIALRNAKEATVRAEQEKVFRGQITVGEVWGKYIEARKSKWSDRTLFDHLKVIKPDRTKCTGEKQRNLKAGVLASLMPLPMVELTSTKVAQWLETETPIRGTQAALAFRLLRAFINWCNDQDAYKGIAAPDACATKVSREHVKKSRAKDDSLQREQLKLWFETVLEIPNLSISSYLQGLLITGARRNELSGLRWDDVDFQWNSITIRDKTESKGGEDGTRTIPLTPYFSKLLLELKNKNETPPTVRRLKTLEARGEQWKPSEWVFSSQTSKTGKLEEPSIAHRKALASVGLPAISLHGLRRSFGSLSEWCECPVGVVAQIQGHKPSATAEKHYRVRPLDLLRMWHTKIETWVLEQAKIKVIGTSDNHNQNSMSEI